MFVVLLSSSDEAPLANQRLLSDKISSSEQPVGTMNKVDSYTELSGGGYQQWRPLEQVRLKTNPKKGGMVLTTLPVCICSGGPRPWRREDPRERIVGPLENNWEERISFTLYLYR